MKLKYQFAVRQIMDEYVVIPMGEAALKFSGMLNTNDVGAFLWRMLRNECSREELIQALLTEFDVDAATAEQDVETFIQKLRDLELLETTV